MAGSEREERRRRAAAALSEARVVLCSACLLGQRTRYDGADRRAPHVERALAGKTVIPICPEVEAGLPVPRPAADLAGGGGDAVLQGSARVLAGGADLSAAFLRGAELARRAAQRYGATVAVLKEGSPSCGTRRVRVDQAPVAGRGVAAAALERAGLIVLSDEDLADPVPAAEEGRLEERS